MFLTITLLCSAVHVVRWTDGWMGRRLLQGALLAGAATTAVLLFIMTAR